MQTNREYGNWKLSVAVFLSSRAVAYATNIAVAEITPDHTLGSSNSIVGTV
jgi:hypothetical protein